MCVQEDAPDILQGSLATARSKTGDLPRTLQFDWKMSIIAAANQE